MNQPTEQIPDHAQNMRYLDHMVAHLAALNEVYRQTLGSASPFKRAMALHVMLNNVQSVERRLKLASVAASLECKNFAAPEVKS